MTMIEAALEIAGYAALIMIVMMLISWLLDWWWFH
jgi:hypothetical protein